MRSFAIAGIILMVLGVLALSIHSVTYFTTEQVVGPLGFFAWDVSRPHTIIISPLAGIAAIGVGLALVFLGPRKTTA